MIGLIVFLLLESFCLALECYRTSINLNDTEPLKIIRYPEQCFLNFFGFVHLYYGVLHIIHPLYDNIVLRTYNHVTLIYASAVQEFCQEGLGLNEKVECLWLKTP